jgi:hypothetical protein
MFHGRPSMMLGADMSDSVDLDTISLRDDRLAAKQAASERATTAP